MPDESTKKLFNQKGVKHTKHRSAILNVLQRANQPLTAEEVFMILKEQGRPINLSTVYRTFDIFTSKGLVTKATFDDGVARYEINQDKHQHRVICLSCRKTMVVRENECPFSALEQSLKLNTGFKVIKHKLELYGYCQECNGDES